MIRKRSCVHCALLYELLLFELLPELLSELLLP